MNELEIHNKPAVLVLSGTTRIKLSVDDTVETEDEFQIHVDLSGTCDAAKALALAGGYQMVVE